MRARSFIIDTAAMAFNGLRSRDLANILARDEYRKRAEVAEATLARVRELAEELVATGDVSIGSIWSDHNIEIGGDILATLDQPGEPT